jgi:thymidylate synthase (FAD)
MQCAESAYLGMLRAGAKPEEARAVLPNSVKTEIAVTGNLRAWRHVLRLRTDKSAHPQIRGLMQGVQRDLVEWMPEVFSA